MQTSEREDVLLELANEYLDLESYEQVLDLVAEDDLHSVECNILIYIDGLYESGYINHETAKLVYERLNIDPDIASQIRQEFFLEFSYFVESTLN